MASKGWMRLLENTKSLTGKKRYSIPAYSEFMPAPRLIRKPHGELVANAFSEQDPSGWPVGEYEEAFELRPGLEHIALEILDSVHKLGTGGAAHGLSRKKLENNPYWPVELSTHAGTLEHERYLLLLPLALSRTQDDHGRVRWTLFGGSEQHPARVFWKGFFHQKNQALPEKWALGFFQRLLVEAYSVPQAHVSDLMQCGFRIWPSAGAQMPNWTRRYIWPGTSIESVRFLLTFEPFSRLPQIVQQGYLHGQVHLLPFPGSLLFWGIDGYRQLSDELPLAMQIPLLQAATRRESPGGIRIPQSGWMHETDVADQGLEHGPVRNTYVRTHRWSRVAKHEDPLAEMIAREDKLAQVLFSTDPEVLGLYGKPIARNAQIWTDHYRLLLDGPTADHSSMEQVMRTITDGGLYGYRFLFPAMRVGDFEVYWHRPLVAYRKEERPVVVHDGPLGYLTAYHADRPDVSRPVEMWPRILDRPGHRAAVQLSQDSEVPHHHQNTIRARKILETAESAPDALPGTFARNLVVANPKEDFERWISSLPKSVQPALHRVISTEKQSPRDALTFHHTSKRSFERRYWRTIVELSAGKFLNKDNADCARDASTRSKLRHQHRDLEALGEYLLDSYEQMAAASGTKGVMIGSVPFQWQTDFDYEWSDGWLRNQKRKTEERDLIAVIPGRDRSRAVIMADHYDTAYMEDVYEKGSAKGARIAAAGADDNHSATAALLHAFPIFCEMSRSGQLGCDIWLVHLTGEEFPSDCLGARHLCECIVQGNLRIRLRSQSWHDLSKVRIQGVYVLDMVAHNNDRAPDIFQISPGEGRTALWLAYQAHAANELWNACSRKWNRNSSRRGKGRAGRGFGAGSIPPTFKHLELLGQIRLEWEPASTLFNTDGQIFSDAGIPVVLFMENYDINRTGYHDTRDTMENIDLDYGSALVSIAIETVARAATSISPLGDGPLFRPL